MPRNSTREAVDKYLVSLNKDPKSAFYMKLRANLGRMVKAAPTFPVPKKAILEALGDPATVSVTVRIQRYDHLNKFFKSPEVQALGFPNTCGKVPRPSKSELSETIEAIVTHEAVDRHLEILRWGDKAVATIKTYRGALYRLADISPTLPASEDHIRVAIGDPEDYKSSTRRNRYTAMNQFFKSKVARDLGLDNPMVDIEIPKKGEPKIVFLTQAEVEALVAAPENEQERCLVLVLLHTGIRIGEVEGLMVSNIADGELTVDGKSGERQVTLDPEMERMLRDLADEDGHIWHDEDGDGPLTLG